MKRIFLIFLALSFVISNLCGCSFKKTFSSENNEYIISAMGFDFEENNFKLYLEAIIVNTEDADAERKLMLLEGEGGSLEKAFSDAYEKATQPLQLNHMGVITIGEAVTDNNFSEIIKFCHSQKGITLSTRFVTCKNSFDLLSGETVSSVAVGYDIMSMLNNQSERKGINYKNCFYEIEALKEKQQNIIALPYFEKTEDSFSINGIKIFKNYSLIAHLNEDEASVYAIMTDTQSKGEFLLNNKKIKLSSSYSSWNIEKNENLKLTLKLKIQIKDKSLEKKNIIKRNIENLYSFSKQTGTDIFGLENVIFIKNNKTWNEIKKDYVNHFKNSTLTVEFI